MIITICAWCGLEKFRTEIGEGTEISHGICTTCKDEFYEANATRKALQEKIVVLKADPFLEANSGLF